MLIFDRSCQYLLEREREDQKWWAHDPVWRIYIQKGKTMEKKLNQRERERERWLPGGGLKKKKKDVEKGGRKNGYKEMTTLTLDKVT